MLNISKGSKSKISAEAPADKKKEKKKREQEKKKRARTVQEIIEFMDSELFYTFIYTPL